MRAQAFTSPLEASIYVEGLRARPAFFVGFFLVAYALLWTAVDLFANPTPDPRLSIGVALGREWELGYAATPPLAPWILGLAHRVGGVTALYALGPLAVALTGWLVYWLARRIAGDRHGAMAIFLMVGVHPVAFPVGAFDADLVQMPLIAAAAIAWWQAVANRNRWGWIALGLICGLLAYAGVQGAFFLAALLLLTVATAQGRASLAENRDQIFAVSGLFLFTLMLTPRMIWLQHHGFAGVMQDFAIPEAETGRIDAPSLVAAVVLGHIGLLVIVALASRYFARDGEIAPVFMRAPIEAFGRRVAIVLALLPPLLGLAAAFLGGRQLPSSAAAPLLLYSGLLVMVMVGQALRVHRQRSVAVAALTLLFLPPALELSTALTAPWIEQGRSTNWPARDAARYMTGVYHTRTGRPLRFIAGSELEASALALMSRDRPRVFIADDPARSPWIARAEIEASGAIAVWEIDGAVTEPPPALVANLPPLVAESPLTLRWVRPGSLDFVRLGWAIIPPKAE